jgi:hypothetical protein
MEGQLTSWQTVRQSYLRHPDWEANRHLAHLQHAAEEGAIRGNPDPAAMVARFELLVRVWLTDSNSPSYVCRP